MQSSLCREQNELNFEVLKVIMKSLFMVLDSLASLQSTYVFGLEFNAISDIAESKKEQK